VHNYITLTLLVAVSASCAAQSGSSCGSQAADAAARSGPPKPAACHDATPHTEKCVTVDNGVQLQVLDWGGAGNPATMVLLTGLGDNAHVYDQFAFQFTDYFHVIGITRRGFPPSSQPKEGYDVDRRARDDIEVLKALGISKAVFVGHSIAGSELSKIALSYKGYVDKLVYLDADDLSKRFQLPDLPSIPYKQGRDERSLQVFQAAAARMENKLEPDQSICMGMQFDAQGAITDTTVPDWVSAKILDGVKERANPPTDWVEIKAPRLGIFNLPSVQAKMPFYWYLSPEDKNKFDENWPGLVKWYEDTIHRFAGVHSGKPDPIVYTLPDAPHYFFITDQAFVVRTMREFLLGKTQ
jgi:pimeloyl-ACP methyl ester carboxylesterase